MSDKVNVLLVDDQPDKLLSYEVILGELNENLVKAASAREALQFLLKNDVAVVLIDVCMPELDGFQLAAMLREHPRFKETAIIFISAIHLTDVDRIRGYAMGAVDYVPVPVIPDVLRAKVKIFVELHRKTRELEQLNLKLERRVAERTEELEASNARLLQSEQGRSLALAAGQMGSWGWDITTGEWRWDEGQYLLAREVDHRARNALAVIQSIIRLTRAKNVDDYVQTVEGRIKALARAHTLLSESRWRGADLGTLVVEELAPYRARDKVEIKGPHIALLPATAQGIALALHELATNAAKHGALSSLKGNVGLAWQMQSDTLVLKWVEDSGPKIKPPTSRSFGLKVIRASIEQQLGGEAMFDWAPEGLRCTLSIPLAERLAPFKRDAAPDDGRINGSPITFSKADRPRVLLVEDEALVGIMIQECLTEFGFRITGPVCTASEALSAAREGHFDAAILDINLGDGSVYRVAEILTERGVPFIFVTGYDSDSVDSRFQDVPVLQKPIERQMLQKIFVAPANRAIAS
ncbi:MAG: response regulator [Xanthobacteraceae bacterium]